MLVNVTNGMLTKGMIQDTYFLLGLIIDLEIINLQIINLQNIFYRYFLQSL